MVRSFRWFSRLCGPLVVLTLCAQPAALAKGGWQSVIASHDLMPHQVVAVAKSDQTLFLFERHSPLKLAAQYTCTTGQAVGDKLVEGDLKTPEGIYFVNRRIGGGLDFRKYGYEAYTLNYPNPVDRLRRKTGHGIWIHGRGTPIVPRETEGCVALNNPDIHILGKNLAPGTAVALADNIRHDPNLDESRRLTVDLLERRTKSWAKAWSQRSAKLFDFYDAQAYSLAQGESFSTFRAQKERLFRSLPWIDTKVDAIHVMEGPGYWVTWFEQDYRAPNLSTKGVRRLYWQADKAGEYRIVGMEWAPHLSGTLLASAGRPRNQETASDAAEGGLLADSGKTDQAESEAGAAEAAKLAAENRRAEAEAKEARALAAKQEAQAKKAAEKAQQDASGKQDKPAKAEPSIAQKKELAAAFIEGWRIAWQKGDIELYTSCYDNNAVQSGRKGRSAIARHKRALWAATSPQEVSLENIRIEVRGKEIQASMTQRYADQSGYSDKGRKTLVLRDSGQGYRIVKEDWKKAR